MRMKRSEHFVLSAAYDYPMNRQGIVEFWLYEKALRSCVRESPSRSQRRWIGTDAYGTKIGMTGADRTRAEVKSRPEPLVRVQNPISAHTHGRTLVCLL